MIGESKEKLEKLDARYDLHTTAPKITEMSGLVSVRYRDAQANLSKHIDRFATLLEQLWGMQASIDDTLAVGIILASGDVHELSPVIAAI